MSEKKTEVIRIALLGAVSVGKSTLLNSLFVKQYSSTKFKRTTMVPYMFREVLNKTQDETNDIRKEINTLNTEIIRSTENKDVMTDEKCTTQEYFVPVIFDLISPENREKIRLEIYDVPGLDDNSTKAVYFNWVRNNFYLFDIIIFVTSITTALNSQSEIEILNLIIENIKLHKDKYNRKIELMTVVNKCDNMVYGSDNKHEFSDPDDEMNEMYEQIVKILSTEIEKHSSYITYRKPLPLSAEDSFIYRISYLTPKDEIPDIDEKYINKMGINEYGKNKWNKWTKSNYKSGIKNLFSELDIKETYIDRMKASGYFQFRTLLNSIIKENVNVFLEGRLNYIVCKIPSLTADNMKEFYEAYESVLESAGNIDKILGSNTRKSIVDKIQTQVLGYVGNLVNIDNRPFMDIDFTKIDIVNVFEKYDSYVDITIIELNRVNELFTKIPDLSVSIVTYYIQGFNNKNVDLKSKYLSECNFLNVKPSTVTGIIKYLNTQCVKNELTEQIIETVWTEHIVETVCKKWINIFKQILDKDLSSRGDKCSYNCSNQICDYDNHGYFLISFKRLRDSFMQVNEFYDFVSYVKNNNLCPTEILNQLLLVIMIKNIRVIDENRTNYTDKIHQHMFYQEARKILKEHDLDKVQDMYHLFKSINHHILNNWNLETYNEYQKIKTEGHKYAPLIKLIQLYCS